MAHAPEGARGMQKARDEPPFTGWAEQPRIPAPGTLKARPRTGACAHEGTESPHPFERGVALVGTPRALISVRSGGSEGIAPEKGCQHSAFGVGTGEQGWRMRQPLSGGAPVPDESREGWKARINARVWDRAGKCEGVGRHCEGKGSQRGKLLGRVLRGSELAEIVIVL